MKEQRTNVDESMSKCVSDQTSALCNGSPLDHRELCVGHSLIHLLACSMCLLCTHRLTRLLCYPQQASVNGHATIYTIFNSQCQFPFAADDLAPLRDRELLLKLGLQPFFSADHRQIFEEVIACLDLPDLPIVPHFYSYRLSTRNWF